MDVTFSCSLNNFVQPFNENAKLLHPLSTCPLYIYRLTLL